MASNPEVDVLEEDTKDVRVEDTKDVRVEEQKTKIESTPNLIAEEPELTKAEKRVHEADTLPLADTVVLAIPSGKKKKFRPTKFLTRLRRNLHTTQSSDVSREMDGAIPEKDKANSDVYKKPCLKSTLVKKLPVYQFVSMWLNSELFASEVSRLLTLFAVLPLIIWGVLVVTPVIPRIYNSFPDGIFFIMLLLVFGGISFGHLINRFLKLPALLGMLIIGIVVKNVPYINTHLSSPHFFAFSSYFRGIALVVILMRAGLGLDPDALKRMSGTVFRLAFTPCLVETCIVAITSHFLLNLPFTFAFALGFILSAVSPAVVVPCLLELQNRNLGTEKGIPTLVIAAASVDDVLAISGFTVLLGIIFNPSANLVSIIFQGPFEAVIGVLFGLLWGGLLCTLLPSRPFTAEDTESQQSNAYINVCRTTILIIGGLLANFGSYKLEVPGAGALAVLTLAFVAGVLWRNQDKRRSVKKKSMNGDLLCSCEFASQALSHLWTVFQPLLFGLIGIEIKIDALNPSIVGYGLLVILVGAIFRFITAYSVTSSILNCSTSDSESNGDSKRENQSNRLLNVKERLFIAFAWIPKATVQAAIGPVILDQALSANQVADITGLSSEYVMYGHHILTIAVLVILVSAPLGAIAIMWLGPKLLRESGETVNEKANLGSIEVLESSSKSAADDVEVEDDERIDFTDKSLTHQVVQEV